MLAKKIFFILKRFVPTSLLMKMRKKYYHYRDKKIKPLSKAQFETLLVDQLKVKPGQDLFVHSSMQLLKLEFPFYEVMPVLRKLVGPEATLLFPTTHFGGSARDYLGNPDSVFNVRRSASIYGLLSEMARRTRGAMRSLHPTNSVVAIGPHAEEYVENHHLDIYPCGKRSPYYQLVARNARIIGLGVSTEYFSFVHCVEDCGEYPNPVQTRAQELMHGRVINSDGVELMVDTLVAHANIAHRNIPRYMRRHINDSVVRDFTVGGIPFYTAEAYPLYKAMGDLSRQGITIYTHRVAPNHYGGTKCTR